MWAAVEHSGDELISDCMLLLCRYFHVLKSTDTTGGFAPMHMKVKLLRDVTQRNLNMSELHAQMQSRWGRCNQHDVLHVIHTRNCLFYLMILEIMFFAVKCSSVYEKHHQSQIVFTCNRGKLVLEEMTVHAPIMSLNTGYIPQGDGSDMHLCDCRHRWGASRLQEFPIQSLLFLSRVL